MFPVCTPEQLTLQSRVHWLATQKDTQKQNKTKTKTDELVTELGRLTVQNWVCGLVEVGLFLASTAKCCGSWRCFREVWREDPQDKWSWHLLGLATMFPDRDWLAKSSKPPGWLAKFVTESKLTLLATRQANESEMRCWGKEYDFIWKAGRLRKWQTNVSK